MSKKIILSILILLAVGIAVVAWYFYGYQRAKTDPWLFIPDNPALIFHIDKPDQFLNQLEKSSETWQSLLKSEEIKEINEQVLFVDSLFKNNLTINQLLEDPLLISLHYDTAFNQIQVLFITTVKIDLSVDLIRSSLNDDFVVTNTDMAENRATITTNTNNFKVEAGFHDNIILLSTDGWLVNRSLISGLENEAHFSNEKSFNQIRRTAGKKVDARMYVNYKYLSSLLTHFVIKYDTEAILWLEEFAGWSETDVLIKGDEIIMTGFTSSSPSNYLRKYSKQKPEKSTISRVVPSNANILFALCYSDINNIVQAQNIESLSKSVNYDLNKLLAVLGHEIAYASNSNSKTEIENHSWFIAKLKDKAQTKNILKLIGKNTGGTFKSIENIEIGNIKHDDLIPDLFGKSFGTINHSWYTFIDDYVIFGNSSQSLLQLSRYYKTGKTLDVNDQFKNFSDNLSSSSNIMFYIKPNNLTGTFSNYLNKETSVLLKENLSVIKDFEGVAFQFTSNDSLFYTNFYIKTDQSLKEESLAQWKVQLDDVVSGKPYLVKNHKSNSYNILVFDVQSNLYMISNDGQIVWKKRIDALPQSDIFQVDYFKNGKIQYLFNTADFTYIIDKNGNAVESFPKKLNPSSTNGLKLFDYNNDKDYRILLAQADKKVYNYKINGKAVDGWSKPKSQNILTEAVQYVSAKKKDYILLTDIDNNLKIVNRKGSERVKLKKNPDKAKHSIFYANKTNNKGIILTTNISGKLVYISSKGKLKHTDFGNFSADHFFLYEDFDGNNDKDFIYLDGKKLVVFNRFKKVLFKYEFPSDISIKPQFYKFGSRNNILGIVDSQTRNIYLFDKKGNLMVSSGLLGETPFTIGSLKNNSELNLITGVENMIYNYQIK